LGHIVATVTSDYIATMTSDIIVAFDTVVAFVIPLVDLLTSTPVIYHVEHLRNFSAGPYSEE
jgi:hypothetical protein